MPMKARRQPIVPAAIGIRKKLPEEELFGRQSGKYIHALMKWLGGGPPAGHEPLFKRGRPALFGAACYEGMASVGREFLWIELDEEVLAVSYGLDSEYSCVHADGAGDRPVLDDEGDVGVRCFLETALKYHC